MVFSPYPGARPGWAPPISSLSGRHILCLSHPARGVHWRLCRSLRRPLYSVQSQPAFLERSPCSLAYSLNCCSSARGRVWRGGGGNAFLFHLGTSSLCFSVAKDSPSYFTVTCSLVVVGVVASWSVGGHRCSVTPLLCWWLGIRSPHTLGDLWSSVGPRH